MSDETSRHLSRSDREILFENLDIAFEEREQIFQEVPPTPVDPAETARENLQNIREQAEEVLSRVEELKQKVDRKGKRFSVSTNQPRGSSLYKAMVRLFGKRTTEVTYDDYKRALEMRTQLSKEDAEILRNR